MTLQPLPLIPSQFPPPNSPLCSALLPSIFSGAICLTAAESNSRLRTIHHFPTRYVHSMCAYARCLGAMQTMLSQYIPVYLSISQYISLYSVYLSISQYISVYPSISQYIPAYLSISQYIPVYLSISQYIPAYLSISQHISVYHSISQYISVYLSISQYISVYWSNQPKTRKLREESDPMY